MQEIRLVAVSEDGTYLVLAPRGRGTRFTLPVDDRLRAAVKGNFSRLGQYQIEVENPLRPKEIQARIRAGETVEEIAATAGIPVERVRWFEGPVLQEREYMAQQAQRVTLRRAGDSSPGPTLGELVTERLRRSGVDLDELRWDSRKREDGTWRVSLAFPADGGPRGAEWAFDPRRRHVEPGDEEAARLTGPEIEDVAYRDKVTPFVPRLTPRASVTEQAPVTGTPPQLPTGAFTADSGAEPPSPAGAQSAETDENGAQPEHRPVRKAAGGRGRRASVPPWDEIIFGARHQE